MTQSRHCNPCPLWLEMKCDEKLVNRRNNKRFFGPRNKSTKVGIPALSNQQAGRQAGTPAGPSSFGPCSTSTLVHFDQIQCVSVSRESWRVGITRAPAAPKSHRALVCVPIKSCPKCAISLRHRQCECVCAFLPYSCSALMD